MSKRIISKIVKGYNSDTVYKYNIVIQPTNISFLVTETVTVPNQSISIDPETSVVTFLDLDPIVQTNIIQQYNFSLDTLKAYPMLKSNMIIGVLDTDSNAVTINDIRNLSSETYTQRAGNPVSKKVANNPAVSGLQIFVKDVNGTFSDHDIIVNTIVGLDKENNFESNEEFEVTDKYIVFDSLDTIIISRDSVNDTADYYSFKVQSEPYVDIIYLEQDSGIIDRTRCNLTNGVGKVRVLKSSIEDGGDVRIRAGFRYYPALITFSQSI